MDFKSSILFYLRLLLDLGISTDLSKQVPVSQAASDEKIPHANASES